jgi:hypothetical protein
LEALILSYEKVSALRDREAERALQEFEALLDGVLARVPNVPRETLRKSVIKAHRKWALKQENKPLAIPPQA